MRSILFLLTLFLTQSAHAQMTSIQSPDGAFRLDVSTRSGLSYALYYKGKEVVRPSSLSFRLKEPSVSLVNFTLEKKDTALQDETWKPVWGEYSTIRNHYRELRSQLKAQPSNIHVHLVFRLFNEGLGFRFEFPDQPGLDHFVLAEERTQFRMAGDHRAFWIPGDYDTNEYTYYHTKLSEIDATGGKAVQEIHAKTFFDTNAVQTPLMMKSGDGLYINIHEAALLNYPAMNLVLDKASMTFVSHLVPDPVGNRAYLQTPAKTPWRTVIVSDKATDIIAANRMILNLNEPSKIKNTSWIKPQKMVGVWWEMHVNKSSWDYGVSKYGSKLQPHGKHGATTSSPR